MNWTFDIYLNMRLLCILFYCCDLFLFLVEHLQSTYLLAKLFTLSCRVCLYSETLMRVDDLDATVKMLLYTDETYTSAIVSAPVIELREKVSNSLVIG